MLLQFPSWLILFRATVFLAQELSFVDLAVVAGSAKFATILLAVILLFIIVVVDAVALSFLHLFCLGLYSTVPVCVYGPLKDEESSRTASKP
jgi:hypothetical protein